MDKEFIKKTNDANIIIKEARQRLLEAVKNYFENNTEHTVNVNLSCKNPNFYDIISDYPETFDISFKEGDVDINVTFKAFYSPVNYVRYTITSSLNLPKINISNSIKCINKYITINALYEGKMDRKIFLDFEKSIPDAKFKIM